MPKKDENAPVTAICVESCVLAPGEQAEAGEIYDLSAKNFRYFEGLGRFREATDKDIKAAKKAASARKGGKDQDPDPDPDPNPDQK